MERSDDAFFVVIEGIDGSGKTTIAIKLFEMLNKVYKDKIKLTFEPHDPSCAGYYIRQVLMKKIHNVPLKTLALAFAVNRADQCQREIIPFLTKGKSKQKLVICDRYYLSSLVYQSDDQITFDQIMDLNSSAIKPDLIIFLNASNKVCYERLKKRQEDKELFEINLSKVKKKYQHAIEYLKSKGNNIVEINSDSSMKNVLLETLKVISSNAPEWLSTQSIQFPLIMDNKANLFRLTDSTIQKTAISCVNESNTNINNTDILKASINDLLLTVQKTILSYPYNDIATLAIDCLKTKGYKIIAKIPWTDIDAYQLEYELPLKMTQCGSILFLGNTQRYDIVLKKVIAIKKQTQLLEKYSDFMFIFDTSPSHLIDKHYDREMLTQKYVSEISLSPSTQRFGLKEIENIIFYESLKIFIEKQSFALMNIPLLKETFHETINELGFNSKLLF